MLSVDQTVLAVVDVQGKLAQLMHERDLLFLNLQRIIRGAQILDLPVLWCEQNPAGLGPTIPEVASLLDTQQPIAKMSFSCCGDERFLQALQQTGRKQVLLAGIEAHVCIYLTAADLIARGYYIEVIADAVSSRSAQNKQIGLGKVKELGGHITCVETALFELLQVGEGPKFKEVLKLLK